MGTFTPEEPALALEIHRLVKRLNSLVREAEGLGLGVSLGLEEGEEVGEPDTLLRVLVFKAIVIEAANATSTEEPDAVLPHGWVG